MSGPFRTPPGGGRCDARSGKLRCRHARGHEEGHLFRAWTRAEIERMTVAELELLLRSLGIARAEVTLSAAGTRATIVGAIDGHLSETCSDLAAALLSVVNRAENPG